MLRFFHKLHLWLSIPFGIFITIVCLTGAILVFEPEITRALRSDVYYVKDHNGEPRPVAELLATVRANDPDSLTIASVTVFPDPARTYQVNFTKRHSPAVFIDQYSGRITGRYERFKFFTTMLSLHRRLLDNSTPAQGNMRPGKFVVGISTLMLILILISGVVLWWPRAKNNLSKSLTIPLRSGWHRFWSGLHVAGGMYALIFVLVMALTGLTWSFGWYRTAFYSCFGADDPRAPSRPAIELRTDAPAAKAEAKSAPTTKQMHAKKSTDEVPVMTEAETEKSRTFSGWVYAVHTGRFWGLISRILWALAALLGATLPITGYYLWIHRLRRKGR